MELWLAGVDQVMRSNQQFMQVYGRTPEGAGYGPVRVLAGTSWVSRDAKAYDDAKRIKEAVEAIDGVLCGVKPYGTNANRRWVVWVLTYDDAQRTAFSDKWGPQFESLTLSDRVYTRLHLPEQRLAVKKDLEAALQQQRELNDALGAVHRDYLLPLLAEGVWLEDAMRWLHQERKAADKLLGRIRTEKKERLDALYRVTGTAFDRDTTGVLAELDRRADGLEARLKAIAPENFLERCWNDVNDPNPMRGIIYLAGKGGMHIIPTPNKERPEIETRSSDHLLQRRISYDEETSLWWEGRTLIHSLAAGGPRGYVVYTIFQTKATRIEAGGVVAEVRSFNTGERDWDELRLVSRRMMFEAAKVIKAAELRITQNGLGYDNPMANKPGLFPIGSDNSGAQTIPFRRGIIDTYGRQGSADAVDFDLMWMVRANLMAFQTDAKIETTSAFSRLFFDLGPKYVKLHTYQDQIKLAERARNGDEAATLEDARYNVEDTRETELIAAAYAPIRLNIAAVCKVPYFDAFNESPKSIALSYTDRVHMSAVHTPRDRQLYADFDEGKVMARLTDRALGWKHRQGLHKGVLVAYYPFAEHLAPVLKNDATMASLLELARNAKNPVEAYMYHLVCEGWAGEMLCDIERAKEYPGYDKVVWGKYGRTSSDIERLMQENLSGLRLRFANAHVVNRYQNLFFLQQLGPKEAGARGFVVFGEADVLSIAKESLTYRLGGEICSSGISIPSAKRRVEAPGTNPRCALEIAAVRDVVERCFDDPADAMRRAFDYAHQLASGKADLSSLVMKATMHEAPKHSTPAQQRTRRGRVLASFPELKPGESVSYYVADVNGQEGFLPYNLAEHCSEFPMEPWLKWYQDRLFGITENVKEYEDGTQTSTESVSTLYRIAKALTLCRSKRDAGHLQQFLRGKGTAKEFTDFVKGRIKDTASLFK